jgi:hypothetical protein
VRAYTALLVCSLLAAAISLLVVPCQRSNCKAHTLRRCAWIRQHVMSVCCPPFVAGLPPATIHWWVPVKDVGPMLGLAAVVMLVDLLESTSIARALAR